MVCGFSLVSVKGATVEWAGIGLRGGVRCLSILSGGGLHLKIVTERRKMIND